LLSSIWFEAFAIFHCQGAVRSGHLLGISSGYSYQQVFTPSHLPNLLLECEGWTSPLGPLPF
jgi:hypothetical protein